MSPRVSCAKSVMPTTASMPSTRTHSCSVLYRRSSGNSIRGSYRLTSDLGDATGLHRDEAARFAFGVTLGPHVRARQLGIGQHEHPTLGADDLHPVDEHEILALRTLDDLAHHRALRVPGRRNLL